MSSSSSPAKRTVGADDLYAITIVGDPQVSPDGTRIVWVQTTLNKDQDTYRASLWMAGMDGSNALRLTSGSARDTSPVWSPTGSLVAFVSNRPGVLPAPAHSDLETADKNDIENASRRASPASPGEAKTPSQIWVIDPDGGEADQVTNHPNGADSPSWSPDATRLAFVANDDIRPDDALLAPMTRGGRADELVIRDIHYRADGRGFIERYSHIWVVTLSDKSTVQITSGDVFDSQPAWSPDGTRIAFVGNRRDDRHSQWTATSICTVDIAGGVVNALAPDDASFASPVWSADGKRIAFFGHLDARHGGTLNDNLWTVGANGSNLTNHTKDWDYSIGDAGMSDVFTSGSDMPVWSGTNSVYVLASHRGETQVFAVALESGNVNPVTKGAHRVAGFTVGANTMALLVGSIALPFEVFATELKAVEHLQISRANAAFLDEVKLRDAEELEITSADGTSIQGWVMTPSGYDGNPSARFPLILQIHGGPHAMYGLSLFHEMQLMAARGYGVVFCNPRGSGGYGEDFNGCTKGIWGEADMPDVFAAVDAALDLPWVDPARLGITGGSYGGYLTNWVIGHDQRFKAAVTQRCVSNFHSFFGTSDIGSTFGVNEFGGVPWSDAESLLHHSPISYVDKIVTPLLILHSEQDLRCPIEQGEQMFAALKYLDKEVAFIRFPEESHDLSRSGTPSRRIARLHHLVGWFDAHL